MENYNFIEWNNLLKEYSVINKQIADASTHKQKTQLRDKRPQLIKPSLSTQELNDILKQMSNIPLVYNDNGKISTTETLKGIEDPHMRACIEYTSKSIYRSSLYTGNASKNTRVCALVPFFMSAFKEYKGIEYSQWNSKDPLFKWAIGFKLYEDISPFIGKEFSREEIKHLRKLAITAPNNQLAYTDWPRHGIQNKGLKLSNTNLFRHILLQTWMANVEYRNEYMILNVNDFDDIPEAMDELYSEVSDDTSEMPGVAKPVQTKPKESEMLPW